jgi:hypothetical protein
VGVQTGQDACACWATKRRRDVGALEERTLGGNPVQARRLDMLAPCTGEGVESLVVSKYEHQAGTFVRGNLAASREQRKDLEPEGKSQGNPPHRKATRRPSAADTYPE